MTNSDPSFSASPEPSRPQQPRQLVRSDDRMIAGVCAGVAEYFGVDATLVRIVAVLSVLLGFGAGLLLYIVGWLIIPDSSGQTVITWRPNQPASPAQPSDQGTPPATPPASPGPAPTRQDDVQEPGRPGQQD